MRFYFSGAEGIDFQQNDSAKSLGGFKSSSVVPNDVLGNLFGELSYSDFLNNQTNTRCVFLKNELGVTVSNFSIQLHCDNEHKTCEFELAVVIPTQNKVEQIFDPNSSPYFAEFFSDIYEQPSLILPNFENNQVLAFWLKRKINVDNRAKNQAETTTLTISWD